MVLQMLQDFPHSSTILDVGGGHGQLAIPLSQQGFRVSVLGSAESCRHRIQDLVDAQKCSFLVGDVLHLPLPDQSYDVVTSFRLLAHCPQWPLLVRELCRVARKAVIVDYPTEESVNRLAPTLFAAKKKVETNTRPWILFKHQEVRDAFAQAGFFAFRHRKEFLLPMVVHRMLKLKPVSEASEKALALLGLTELWGSPVILRADRLPPVLP
jgi:ubiquinone/menaquinone biosynthesis C-methylase UbiE